MTTRIFVYAGFACTSAPAILYSIYRTGYRIVQFSLNQVLSTLWQQLTLTVIALVVLSFIALPRALGFVGGMLVAAAAIGLVHASFSGWDDYKLWVYVIAPFLLWSFLLAAATTAVASFLFDRKRS